MPASDLEAITATLEWASSSSVESWRLVDICIRAMRGDVMCVAACKDLYARDFAQWWLILPL